MHTPSQPEHRSPFALSHCGRWLLPALLILCGLWLAMPQTVHAQTVITVDADAPGPLHNGLSWTTAYTTVQDALDVTNANGETDYEVWVAEGVYYPDEGGGHVYPDEGGGHVANAVSESFRIEWNNVQLYGGFAATETLRTQRDWTAHPTILSGDIDGDDANTDGNFIAETWADIQGSNAYHVLFVDGSTNQSITSATVLDGFTLTAGQAIGGDSPDHFGGALYCIGSDSGDHVADTCSPALANLTFSGNRAFYGGAMVNNASQGVSSPTLTNATFRGNQAITGGALLIVAAAGTSNPALTNVAFRSNQADFGGAMVTYVYPDGAGSPTLTNVLFSGNQATSNGGAMINYSESGVCTPTLVNVTFSGNQATEGGAIHSDSVGGVTNPTLINTILWGNTAITSTQIHNAAATATLAYSLVEGGCPVGATCGAGMLASDPQFIAPIAASSAPTITGDYRLQTGSPAIDAGNRLSVTAATALDGAARIQGCTVDMGAYEAGPLACLGAAKQVSPAANVAYQGVVTYTLTLSNSGNLTDTATLTDTLPAEVDFGAWVQNPGATVTNDALAWTGTITPATVLTFTFTATHTHGVSAAITNSAFYSGALQSGSAAAGFTALCGVHITVQSSGDSGAGSLRQAIADLCPGGVIDFAPLLRDQTIPLSSELTIAKSLTITGSVPVTLSGGGSVRIFAVNAGVQATLAGLTLDNGVADSGGAIHNAGALTVTHSGVYNSAAGNGGGLYNEGVLVVQASSLAGNTATDPIGGGGAVFNTGVLTLTDSRLAGNAGEFGAALVNLSGGAWVQRSTFANNRANTAGAGIYTSAGILHIAECTFTGNATGSDAGAYGGALVTDGGELFVARTTIANNHAFNGGGVYLMGAGVAAIHNSTLAGNLATNSGGGIYNESSIPVALVNNTITGNGAANSGGVQNYGTLSLTNTVIANSVTGGDCRNGDPTYGFTIGVVAANAHNLFASTAITETCGIADGAGGSLTGVDPLLGVLGDYGGNTQTLPLLPGSPAIDAGDAATCAAAHVAGVDQRGVVRPQGAVCDIGAFESRGFSVTGSGGSGQSTVIGTAFAQPLTLTLTSAYTEPVGGGHVRFTPPAAGAGLNTADPFTLTTDAGGAVSTPVRANLFVGSYTVTASVRGVLAPVSFSLTNTRLPVTVTVASAVNPSRYGESVNFTATVQALQASDAIDSQKTQTGPTGAVTLTIDGSDIGTNLIDATGTATFTYSGILRVGDHPVTAHYAGDDQYAPQAAAPITQTVNRATPTAAADHAPSPSRYGETVTFTATVRAPVIGGSGVGGGLATPSGVVTFTAGATWLGAAPLDAAGGATYTTAGLVVGSHLVTAAYGGDGNYEPATAAPVTQTVLAAATATGLASAPNPSVFGQSVTFTATVTVNAPGAGTPSGVVTFTTAGGDLGTGTLTGGVATVSTSELAVGSHVITATYGGNGSFAGSIAAPVTQIVTPAPVTIQVSAEPVAGGVVAGGGVYAHNAAVTVTATANAGYAFLHWAESGAPVTTTARYPFTATADRALLAHFAPLPLARNDAAGVLEGAAVTIAVLANDINPAGGALTVIAVSQPAHGAASINPDNATVQYAALPAIGGLDSFTYTLRDANGQQSTALVAVVVTILPETDVAPQVVVVDPALPHTIPFTSTQATVTADVPAGVYTGALTLPQVFFLSYTPIVTPTAHTLTPPGALQFGNFEFDLAAFIDDVPQPGFRFAQPITLTIHYDPALLHNLLPETLALTFWDGTGWSTDGIVILSHDLATATLTVSIAHPGEFAFFAVPVPTVLEPAPEPNVDGSTLYLPAVMR